MVTLTVNTSIAGAPSPGNLTIPAAWFTEWDWDETAVTSWDTDTTANTQADLRSAIQTAMGQGTTASPQYHRIRWTGGNIVGNLDLSAISASLPDFFGPHILVYSTTWDQITGSIVTGSSLSNVAFKGFEFRTAGGSTSRWIAPSTGNSRRIALFECRGGGHPDYANVAWTSYPKVFSGSGTQEWWITVRNCTIRGIAECFELWSGTRASFKHNFVTNLADDITFQMCRNVAPYVNYVYSVGNVVCDLNDVNLHPQDDWHPDFMQQGTTFDGPNDEYYGQAYGNIYIGDTYQQHPSMAAIIQIEGQSIRHQIEFVDNIFLTTLSPRRKPGGRAAPTRRNFGLPGRLVRTTTSTSAITGRLSIPVMTRAGRHCQTLHSL